MPDAGAFYADRYLLVFVSVVDTQTYKLLSGLTSRMGFTVLDRDTADMALEI